MFNFEVALNKSPVYSTTKANGPIENLNGVLAIGSDSWKAFTLKDLIRGFPKVDHSGLNARIVLEQNSFTQKNATSNRTWTLDPRTVVLISCVQSHPSCQLSYLGKC